MRLGAFSIYDVKVEAYGPPFYARTFGEAERFFRDILADPNSVQGKHPEDYQLFRVGEFDQGTGQLLGVEEVTRVPVLEVSHG